MCSKRVDAADTANAKRSYPLRSRIIRNVILASGVTAFVVLVLIFVVSWRYLVGDTKEQLTEMTQDLKNEYEKCGGDTPRFRELMNDHADEFSVPMMFILLTTEEGKLLHSTFVAEDLRARVLEAIVQGQDAGRVSTAGTSLRDHVSAFRFQVIPLPGGNRIVMGVDVTPIECFLLFLVGTLLVGFVLMVGGAALITGVFATRLVRCLDRIALTASEIEQGDWSRRVEEEGMRVREVRTLVQMFNAMCDTNERTLAELRMLTDNIAHDLRTPLTRLGMAAESEATRCSPDGQLPDIVMDEVSAMLEMINTMLDISQTDAKIDRSPKTELDLVAAVTAAIDLYQPLAEQNGIALTGDTPASPVPFLGHREKMQQLLGNLIENAIKFTPRDGRVKVSLALVGEQLVLQVADSGCGIAPSDLPYVFKRFWRADSSRSLPGNGLGLALVKAIVTSYGGHIDCTSALGTGTTFTIRIPCA